MELILQYLGIVIGTLIEGEITLVSASIAAKLGHLDLYWVMLAGLVGAQLTDWINVLLGRYVGKSFVDNRPKLKRKLKKVNRWFEKYPVLILLSFRFMYGFRTIIPVAIGLSNISLISFAIYSFLSTIVWVVLYSVLGYFLGNLILLKFEFLNAHSWEILIGTVVLVGLIGLVRMIRLRRRLKKLKNRHKVLHREIV